MNTIATFTVRLYTIFDLVAGPTHEVFDHQVGFSGSAEDVAGFLASLPGSTTPEISMAPICGVVDIANTTLSRLTQKRFLSSAEADAAGYVHPYGVAVNRVGFRADVISVPGDAIHDVHHLLTASTNQAWAEDRGSLAA